MLTPQHQVQRVKLLSRLLIKRCQSEIYKSLPLFVCLFFLAILPFCFIFPGIREYVFDNFMVSAIYNGVIIAIYITGSLCALFTILKNISAKDILIAQDASRKIAFFLTSIRFCLPGSPNSVISIY